VIKTTIRDGVAVSHTPEIDLPEGAVVNLGPFSGATIQPIAAGTEGVVIVRGVPDDDVADHMRSRGLFASAHWKLGESSP
jgi:predicted RecA/RadA family phage recombinase